MEEEKERELITTCCSKIISALYKDPNYGDIFTELQVFIDQYKPDHVKITKMINIAIDEILTYKPIKVINKRSLFRFTYLPDLDKNIEYEEYLHYINIIKRFEKCINIRNKRKYYSTYSHLIFLPTAEYQFPFSVSKKHIVEAIYETIEKGVGMWNYTNISNTILIKSMQYFDYPQQLINLVGNRNPKQQRSIIIGYIGDELYYDIDPKNTVNGVINDVASNVSVYITGKKFDNHIDISYEYSTNNDIRSIILIKRFKINVFLKQYIKIWCHNSYFIFDPEKYSLSLELTNNINEDIGKEGEW